VFYVFLVVLLVVLAACSDDAGTTTTTAADGATTTAADGATTTTEAMELTEVVIAVPNSACFTYLPMYVAMEYGYYEELGLDLQVEAVDGSSAVVQALVAGNADFGIPSPTLVMVANEAGNEMITFYNVKPGGSFGLIVEEDSGINTPEDLRGEVIGISTADGSEVSFANAIFESVGMVEGEDFEYLVVGDGGPAVAGFTRGDIVAYASAYSDTAVITQAGLTMKDITPADVRAYFFGNGFTTMKATMDAHPEWITAMGKGMARGSELTWSDDGTIAVDVCGVVSPSEVEDREFALALVGVYEQPFAPLGSDPWGYFDPASWQTQMEVAVSTGALEGPLPQLEGVAFTNEFNASFQP
jgi:NitT/TauT family transport system substrate-binding protein